MTKETCVEFTKRCTGEMSYDYDPRVVIFMNKYDPEKEGSVSFAHFPQFFVDACVSGRDDTLRENLRKLGYA